MYYCDNPDMLFWISSSLFKGEFWYSFNLYWILSMESNVGNTYKCILELLPVILTENEHKCK